MNIKTNDLIKYFATSSIQFGNAFKSTLPARKKDSNRKTDLLSSGIIIPIKGEARFSLNGIPYHINANTIVHTGGGMNIEIKTFNEDWTYAVVHYQLMDCEKQENVISSQHFSFELEQMSEVLDFTKQLLSKNMNPDYYSQFEVKVLFMNLIQAILSNIKKNENDTTQMKVSKILDYFHTHYEEEVFMSEIAEQFEMDKRKIASQFERVTGLTPVQYLMRYRISKAKELLRISDLTVSEVAESVGYQDSFYFSRVFKNVTEMSPTQYRKLHQSLRETDKESHVHS